MNGEVNSCTNGIALLLKISATADYTCIKLRKASYILSVRYDAWFDMQVSIHVCLSSCLRHSPCEPSSHNENNKVGYPF